MRILLPLNGAMNPQVRGFFSQMANASEVTVVVAHVLALPAAPGLPATTAANALLAGAAQDLRSLGPSVVQSLAHGDAADEIIALGRQFDVDLIVMYARARGVTQSHARVTERVLNRAGRPVIAINDYVGWSAKGLFGRVRLSVSPNQGIETKAVG
jgi:nucleotide-binding universal stress UspA family protein